jgi:hypothetical protein
VPALARPVAGRPRVARTLIAWGKAGARIEARFERAEVNGQPGAIMLDRGGVVIGVMALDILEGRIQGVRSIVNPDKIAHVDT